MDEWTKVPERLCGAALRPAGPCWRGPTAIFILSSTFRRIVQKNQYVPLIPKNVARSIEGVFFFSLARNSAVGAEAAKGFPLSPPWCGSPWMRKKVIMDPQSAKKKICRHGSPGDPLCAGIPRRPPKIMDPQETPKNQGSPTGRAWIPQRPSTLRVGYMYLVVGLGFGRCCCSVPYRPRAERRVRHHICIPILCINNSRRACFFSSFLDIS